MGCTTNFIGDLEVKNGDLTKKGGDYVRVCGIKNMITLLVGTDSGFWGNLIEPTASQIPGGLEKLNGAPITSSFLNTKARAIEKALYPLITSGIAKSLTVKAYNITADRVDWTAKIVLKDGSLYTYSTDLESDEE
jgi:phage gp46-like protein